MAKFKRRSLASVPAPQPADKRSQDAAQPPQDAGQGEIPAHVWTLLQDAGEAAAERLLAILTSPKFNTYAPSAQARLIELAMVRAYGLPVRRSVEVKLSSSDADAVASSIEALRGALPERHSATQTRDVTPMDHDDPSND